jgi:hypothetical protein
VRASVVLERRRMTSQSNTISKIAGPTISMIATVDSSICFS